VREANGDLKMFLMVMMDALQRNIWGQDRMGKKAKVGK